MRDASGALAVIGLTLHTKWLGKFGGGCCRVWFSECCGTLFMLSLDVLPVSDRCQGVRARVQSGDVSPVATGQESSSLCRGSTVH